MTTLFLLFVILAGVALLGTMVAAWRNRGGGL